MRVLTLAGSGAQRGLDYGREEAAQIAQTATALKAHLAATGHPPAALVRRLTTSPMSRVAADLTPDLWEEVTSLAHAGRVPLDDLLLLVFLPDLAAYSTQPTGADADDELLQSTCVGGAVLGRVLVGGMGQADTSGLRGDARPREPDTTELGQTIDLPDWARDRMTVLRIGTLDAPNAVVMAYPGSIGLCGANDDGLAVATCSRPGSPVSTQGLGVAFVVRRLLELSSVEAAEGFLRAVPHCVGQSYVVAGSDGLACFEVDADGIRRVGDGADTVIVQADHSIGRGTTSRAATESSRERLATLTEAAARHAPLAEALSSPVLLDGQRWSDPRRTFGAFRAVGNETSARFIDGTALAAGRDWTRVTYV